MTTSRTHEIHEKDDVSCWIVQYAGPGQEVSRGPFPCSKTELVNQLRAFANSHDPDVVTFEANGVPITIQTRRDHFILIAGINQTPMRWAELARLVLDDPA